MNQIDSKHDTSAHIIKSRRWQMAFWGLVILVAGIVMGVAATIFVAGRMLPGPMPGPGDSVRRMMAGMSYELALTPEQQRAIEPLVTAHMEKLEEVRRAAQPQVVQEIKLMHDEISKLLTPAQLRIWKDRLKRIPEDFRPPMGPPANHAMRDNEMPSSHPPRDADRMPPRRDEWPRNDYPPPVAAKPQQNEPSPAPDAPSVEPPSAEPAPEPGEAPQPDGPAEPEYDDIPPPDDGMPPPPGDEPMDGLPMPPPD